MKTRTKWILGIIVGLVVVAVIVGAAFFFFNRWHFGGGWMMSDRFFGPFDDWPEMHMNPIQRMPGRFHGGFGFFPWRAIGGGLVCLSLLALLIGGVVLLVRSLRRSNQPATTTAPSAPVTTPAAPAPAASAIPFEAAPTVAAVTPAPVTAPESKTCSSCQRPVQPDWSHCPYCGNNLA